MVEGIMKYLSIEVYGPHFFNEIGFHHELFWVYFTGIFEITCGILVLLGLVTRAASIPLLIIMITAFITTKLPLISTRGFWSFAHAYTTDFSLTVLLILLLINGGGKYSLDFRIMQKKFSS
jgi:uncharacterized membrane protein YphA (DoxX/SURF4 family)